MPTNSHQQAQCETYTLCLLTNISWEQSPYGEQTTQQRHTSSHSSEHKKNLLDSSKMPHQGHTLPIMNELNLLTITNIYIMRVCIEIHPYIHKDDTPINRPEHNHQYTKTSQIHNHSTRYATQKHHYISHDTEHLTKKFTKIWNTIPQKYREITKITLFKNKIKDYLLNKQKGIEDE